MGWEGGGGGSFGGLGGDFGANMGFTSIGPGMGSTVGRNIGSSSYQGGGFGGGVYDTSAYDSNSPGFFATLKMIGDVMGNINMGNIAEGAFSALTGINGANMAGGRTAGMGLGDLGAGFNGMGGEMGMGGFGGPLGTGALGGGLSSALSGLSGLFGKTEPKAAAPVKIAPSYTPKDIQDAQAYLTQLIAPYQAQSGRDYWGDPSSRNYQPPTSQPNMAALDKLLNITKVWGPAPEEKPKETAKTSGSQVSYTPEQIARLEALAYQELLRRSNSAKTAAKVKTGKGWSFPDPIPNY